MIDILLKILLIVGVLLVVIALCWASLGDDQDIGGHY